MRSPLFARKGTEDSQNAKNGRDRGERREGASLTATASAYKDDGFVNYGRSWRWFSAPRAALQRTSLSVTTEADCHENFLFLLLLHLLLACAPHRRCTVDKHAYTPIPCSV